MSCLGGRSPEQEIERLTTALAVLRKEYAQVLRENQDLARLVHTAGLDGEPMAPLTPPEEG